MHFPFKLGSHRGRNKIPHTHTLKHAALQPVFTESWLIGSHSGGFMVVLMQLDVELVLQQLKTQVPGEARRNAFTAHKQTYLL